MKKCLHLHIRGLVQGVCYRISAQMKATELGLYGFARNLADGRVEIMVTGKPEMLEKFIRWCECGPAMAQVTEVQQQEVKCPEAYNEFEVCY